jgi:hypothetical protein
MATSYWPAVRQPQPSPVWASLQVPAGTGRLWFIPGEQRSVDVRLWNLADESCHARLTLELLGQSRVVEADVPAMICKPLQMLLRAPADAPVSLTPLRVSLSTSLDSHRKATTYSCPVRIATGATVEFFGNSYLERELYLEPGGSHGASESCRFGRDWTYRLPVPFPCTARLSLYLGAHRAGPFKLLSSQDAEAWETVLEGRGNRAWREVKVPGLRAGPLLLRFAGQDVQVQEVVVTWERQAGG